MIATTHNQQMVGDFLSENFDAFPFAPDEFMGRKTVLFVNKGVTGCGGTTLVADTAIWGKMCVVCLMPTVSAVQSKERQFCDRQMGTGTFCPLCDTVTDNCTYISQLLGIKL